MMSRLIPRPLKRHCWLLGVLLAGVPSPLIARSQPEPPRITIAQIMRPVLKSGDRGAEVTELQATLKLLGFYEGAVDGTYGKDTIAAVSRFQQAAGLSADGVVGAATWNRLFPPMAEASAAPPAPNPTPSPTAPTPTSLPQESTLPILRIGMRGAAVSALQERLRAIGVYQGAIDGVFGPETQGAVKSAQRRFRLESDGVVGPSTWTALLQTNR